MRRADKSVVLTLRFQEALGYKFVDTALLHEALTHSSVNGPFRGQGESSTKPSNYERLEFLGDRVLGLVIADTLLKRYPHEAEGALAKRHAMLVSRETLSQIGREIDLSSNLISAKNDRNDEKNQSVLADALEAVIAALYRDGGLSCAASFIERHWYLAMSSASTPPQDAKSSLQEWAMSKALPLPSYTEVSREGPPHEPIFTVVVSVTGYPETKAQGPSKRVAEQKAAAILFKIIEASSG